AAPHSPLHAEPRGTRPLAPRCHRAAAALAHDRRRPDPGRRHPDALRVDGSRVTRGMSKPLPADSVGLVVPQRHRFEEPLALDCGITLDSYELVFETYGTLDEARDNAVLVCHALSGDHHAA